MKQVNRDAISGYLVAWQTDIAMLDKATRETFAQQFILPILGMDVMEILNNRGLQGLQGILEKDTRYTQHIARVHMNAMLMAVDTSLESLCADIALCIPYGDSVLTRGDNKTIIPWPESDYDREMAMEIELRAKSPLAAPEAREFRARTQAGIIAANPPVLYFFRLHHDKPMVLKYLEEIKQASQQ